MVKPTESMGSQKLVTVGTYIGCWLLLEGIQCEVKC